MHHRRFQHLQFSKGSSRTAAGGTGRVAAYLEPHPYGFLWSMPLLAQNFSTGIFVAAVVYLVGNALISDPLWTGVTFAIVLAGVPVYYVAFKDAKT